MSVWLINTLIGQAIDNNCENIVACDKEVRRLHRELQQSSVKRATKFRVMPVPIMIDDPRVEMMKMRVKELEDRIKTMTSENRVLREGRIPDIVRTIDDAQGKYDKKVAEREIIKDGMEEKLRVLKKRCKTVECGKKLNDAISELGSLLEKLK